MLRDVTRGWGGGCYWQVVGRGQGGCSNSKSAQGSIPPKSIKCQQCSAPGQPSSHVLEHLQRPLSEYRGSPTDLSYTSFQKVPSPSLIRQDSWRDGREEGGDHSGDHERRCSLRTPTTPNSHKGEIPDLGDLWSNRKHKAELKGQPLDPTCLVAKVGELSLCTEVHAREQMPGPCSLGSQEEKQAGQAGGRRLG